MNTKINALAVIAFFIILLTTPFELIGIPISAIAALVLGAIAGGWAAGAAGEHAGRSATGRVATAVLLGSIVSLVILAVGIVQIPGVAQYIQASEPHPEARIALEAMTPLAGAAGLLGGLLVGLVNLVLAFVGGLVATMMRSHGVKLTA